MKGSSAADEVAAAATALRTLDCAAPEICELTGPMARPQPPWSGWPMPSQRG